MYGIYTALVTPFTSTGALDFKSYEKLLKRQLDAKIHGLIPCGTTGESPTLSVEEKIKLVQFTVDYCKGSKTKVFAGSGSNSTSDTIYLSKTLSALGVDGLLVVTPYYNKPTQSGLIQHFRSVASSVKCEVMLYNVPSRTGISLTAESITQLSKIKNINSIKEASGSLPFASEIRSKCKIKMLSGDDVTFLPFLTLGGVGVVSVASNIIPKALINLLDAYQNKDLQTATKLHDHYYPLFRDLFIESNPAPIKYLLSKEGVISNKLRSPLVTVSSKNAAVLNKTWKKI